MISRNRDIRIAGGAHGSTGMRGLPFVIVALAFVVLILSASCDRTVGVPGQFFTIDDAQWPYGESFVYNPRGDTVGDSRGIVVFSVRHTNDYPYANLWIELAYNSSDTVVADTFNIILADEYGKWLGTGAAPVILKSDSLRLRYLPNPDASYYLRHIMRVDVLPEIEQVGITPLADPNI